MFPLLQLCVFQKKEKGKFGLILTCSLHCRVQLKGLKRKSLLENLGDGFSKVGMHDLWHEFAVMETSNAEPYLLCMQTASN
jgi:hypothetical protein